MKKIILALLLLLVCSQVNAQKFQLDTLFINGEIDSRINIVILGDGYLQSELPQYDEHARTFINKMFEDKPFAEYKAYFNAFSIRVPSNESGAAMSPSQLIDNYFGSTFNYGGIDRLLVATKSSRIISVLADNFPKYDQVIMLVNSTKYGGSGGWVATSSVIEGASEIVLHEIGHSFAALADEYWAGNQYAHERVNMTRETSPEKVKWKNWYGDYGIGIYQHCCGGNSAEWYRPHEDCKMRYLGPPFCPVCLQTIVARIHNLTFPINSYHPDNEEIEAVAFPIRFSLDLLKPEPNTLKVEWVLNSSQIAENVETLELIESDLTKDNNLLTVYVRDTTELIRIDGYEEINLYSLFWNIVNNPSGVEYQKPQTDKINLRIYPNPTSDYIYLEIAGQNAKNLKIELFDNLGNKIFSTNSNSLDNNQISINLTEHPDGVYFLQIIENSYPIVVSKIIKVS